MHAYAWRLTYDQNASRFASAQYRPWTKGQMSLASAAFAYCRQQRFEGWIFRFFHLGSSPSSTSVVIANERSRDVRLAPVRNDERVYRPFK